MQKKKVLVQLSLSLRKRKYIVLGTFSTKIMIPDMANIHKSRTVLTFVYHYFQRIFFAL